MQSSLLKTDRYLATRFPTNSNCPPTYPRNASVVISTNVLARFGNIFREGYTTPSVTEVGGVSGRTGTSRPSAR